MKLLIFATLILAAADNVKYKVREDIAESWEKLYEPHKEECILESGVNEDDVRDLFKRGHYPNIVKFMCYIKCIAIHFSNNTENGNFNEDILQHTRRTATDVDLDILEHSMKVVEDIEGPCEKFYEHVTTAVSKVAIRYPPRNEIH